MGKGIDRSEYDRATTQLEKCKVKTCPNAGANPSLETSVYCGACKAAKKVVKEYERSGARAAR